MKVFKTVLVLLGLIFFASCNDGREATGDPGVEERSTADTVFVPLDVNNANRDSLEKIFGKFVTADHQALLDQGQSVGASIRLNVALHPASWVTDFENIYTEREEDILDSIVSNYELGTSTEMAVVTIDSTWTTRDGFDQFVLRLHNSWGLGKKEKNNGILIGISRGYKMIRISNGSGIRKMLSDEKTKEIIDNIMIPHFAKESYFLGTHDGIYAITDELDRNSQKEKQ